MKMENRKLIYVLIALPIILLVLFIGIYIGENRNYARTDTKANLADIANSKEFSAFWKTWQVLEEKYIDAEKTSNQTKIYGAIKGLTESYNDPYTIFLPPVETKLFKEDITGDFGGIGIEIGIKDKQLQVISPIKDSPADKVGIKAGDLIVSINGTSTAGMNTEEAVKLIRGPKGTSVNISLITANSSKPITKTIIRDTIKIPTIDISTKPGNITVISLYSFTAQSPQLFRNALREFLLSGNHKLILDLRRNPGGYLDAAWDIASWFLPAGKIIVSEDFGDNNQGNVFRSKGYNIFNDKLSMVVLVDNGSASAAEILAGALQEHGIAKLVGKKTFGKGSVQELVSITKDTSLKVTIANWLTPKGHNLSHDGLNPDYEVEITEKDLATKRDPQMEKAIQLLNNIQ